LSIARRRLGLEVGVVLAAKFLLLFGLYFLLFDAPARNDAPSVSTHLFDNRAR
jgi:hypothetical protein